MPPEWAPHTKTWMAWPSADYTLGETEEQAAEAYQTWANVANAVVEFEPVTMLCQAKDIPNARTYLDSRVEILECELDDGWARDIGATFVKDSAGNLGAVNWIFNGWGAQSGWAKWDKDALVASKMASAAGARLIDSPLINEGGGIHVNGAGAVLLTQTVQLGEGRNASWTKAQVETELANTIGADKPIWVRRGLTRDYDEFGTRGHIDIVACFANETTILYHDQQDPSHPDFAVSRMVEQDLGGHGFTLVAVPAPKILEDEAGWVDYSYINHYLVNDGVILCAFADENDQMAKTILEAVYPNRKVMLVDARPLFARGGGIHCITQQQPS